MILMQTKALFIDAYRELNAKKLFWITMALNLFAVVLYASLGINARGFSVLFWTFDGQFNTSIMSKETFYKFEFITWGVPYWLSWGATILALISTAGIIPDLISGGTIEPVLSKPIGRIRLFFTKYLTGLLFVFLQITVFSLGCFMVLGIRAGAWEFGLFLAIPIVLAFFSYLFSVCALIGLITRSTIAALLLTILFWLFVFIINAGEAITVSMRETYAVEREDAPALVESQVRFAEQRIEIFREEGRPIPGEGDEPLPEDVPDSLQAVNPTLGSARENLEKAERAYQSWAKWASAITTLKLVLPKTQETISLLERNLLNEDELDGFISMMQGMGDPDSNQRAENDRVNERIQSVYENRTTIWILGTSLIFEFFVLGICCVIFVRRDF